MIFRKFLIVAGNKFLAAYRAFLVAVSADGGVAEAQVYTNALLQTASNASIVQIPSAYKATVLYNQVPTPTGEDFTVARASDVTRTNEDGVLEVLGSNVPCIDYSDGFPVLLTQPQSTNFITYSNDFSDVYWTAQSTNITTVFGQSSPDGTLNATRITATAGSPSRLRASKVITSGVSTTVSLYIKRVSGSGIVSFFNANGGSAVSLPITNEWERYSVSVVSTSTTGSFILDIATDGDIIDVWGAQLEQLSYATSYIPTSGASATRLEDVITGAGSTSSINSEEGVFYVETAALANDGTFKSITLSSGLITQRIIVGYTSTLNQIQFYMQSSSGNQIGILHTVSDALDFNKIAIKWKANDAALYVNGIEVATDISVVTDAANTYDRLNFTDYNGTSSSFYGKTKQLRVYSSIAEAQIDLPYIL